VTGWLALQTPEFLAGITVVAVDPSAPFAAALRRDLPDAQLVVDCWHLHRLANLMLTQVRQRVTQQSYGHRGTATMDVWAYRRLLLRGGRHLSTKQWKRLERLFATQDRPVRSERRGPRRSAYVSCWTTCRRLPARS
jgi:transposase